MMTHFARPLTLVFLLLPLVATSFVLQSPSVSKQQLPRSVVLHATPTFILGRFRKKQKVDQPKMVEIGDVLPDVDVEQLVRASIDEHGGHATGEPCCFDSTSLG